jgi:glycosyltransferase involved in cell wall biosynthesis
VTPLISVIIPCYNQGPFLADAIASVKSSARDDTEIIVVDDGSEDGTARIASVFSRTRCVRQDNSGLAAARNRGLRESRGRFLVFLDADDMLAPGALDTGAAELAANPRTALVFGRCRMMARDGTLQATPERERIERNHYCELLKRNYIWMPAMAMFRREPIERTGGFDPSVNAAADFGVYLRIARSHPIHDHGRVVAYYRKHEGNMSGNAGRMLQETLTVLRRERRVAEQDPALLAAYYEGWQMWQDFYGTELVNEIRGHVRDRQWTRVLRKSTTLAWLHPGGLRHHALRKVSRSLGRRPDARGSTTSHELP